MVFQIVGVGYVKRKIRMLTKFVGQVLVKGICPDTGLERLKKYEETEKGRASLDMKDRLRISKEMSMFFTCSRSRKENRRVNQSRLGAN